MLCGTDITHTTHSRVKPNDGPQAHTCAHTGPQAHTPAQTPNTRPDDAATPDLGNSGIKQNTAGQALTADERAHRRQAVMWKITRDDNLRGCHRYPVGAEVGVRWGGKGHAGFSGLQNTRSVHGSPLAARAILHTRKVTMIAAIRHWLTGGEGRAVLHIPFTVRHDREQGLGMVWDGLDRAWSSMTNTPAWRRKVTGDKARFGIRHYYRNSEVTHGFRNGWHPHLHTLFFLDRALSVRELADLKASLFARWESGAVNAGLDAPLIDYALHIDQITDYGTDARNVAGYVTKGMTAGLAAETTGGEKEGRADNLTPFQILDVLADHDDAGEPYPLHLVALWREYEAASKGRRSSWSRGAKKALGIDFIDDDLFTEIEAELIADQAAHDDADGAERPAELDREPAWVVVAIGSREWKQLGKDMAARQRIRDAVAQAENPQDAQRYARLILDDLGIAYTPRMVPLDVFDPEPLPTHAEALGRELREVLTVDA